MRIAWHQNGCRPLESSRQAVQQSITAKTRLVPPLPPGHARAPFSVTSDPPSSAPRPTSSQIAAEVSSLDSRNKPTSQAAAAETPASEPPPASRASVREPSAERATTSKAEKENGILRSEGPLPGQPMGPPPNRPRHATEICRYDRRKLSCNVTNCSDSMHQCPANIRFFYLPAFQPSARTKFAIFERFILSAAWHGARLVILSVSTSGRDFELTAAWFNADFWLIAHGHQAHKMQATSG